MIVGKKTKAYHVYSQKSMIAIKYAIKKIKQSRISPYVQGLYLYGSCARKEQNYNSDVDLFLVLSSSIDAELYRDDILILKSEVTPMDSSLPEVDLQIEIGDKWKKSNILYYNDIKREGVQIWKAV